MKKTKFVDPFDVRLKDKWEIISFRNLPSKSKPQAVAILSYPDDEGVKLNNGRPGAKEGPSRILHYLGKMVQQKKTPSLFIVSDVLKNKSLAERHHHAEERVRTLLSKNYRVITLGGGHDYGYPDAAAFLEHGRGTVLNMDAHLDMRPVLRGQLNSGTAFYRLMKRFPGRHLIEWGIQKQCNAPAHLQWAQTHQVKVLHYRNSMPEIKGTVGLSICLDAFAGIRGVSAPAMVGFSTEDGAKCIERYAPQTSWLGVYECAPRYDPLNEDSAQFAALLIYRTLH